MSPLVRFALATAIAPESLPVPAQMAPTITGGASGLLCSEPEFSRLNTSKLELYMHRLARIAIVATIAASFSATASAAATPADAIKYRRAVMDGLSAHVSAFVLINFGKVEHQDHLKAHANALADLGAQAKVLFPAGSDNGETEALPLIWEAKEQEQFKKLVSALETSSAKLRDAVAASDKPAAMAAFKALGDSCKGCHDRYRKKDD
jgi:cytochrome c556